MTNPAASATPESRLRPSHLTAREMAFVAAFWLAYAALSVAGRLFDRGGSGSGELMNAGAVAFGEALCWILLTPLIFHVASRFDSERGRALQALVYVGLGICVALVLSVIANELREQFPTFRGGGPPRGRRIADGVRRMRQGPRGGPPLWFGIFNAMVLYVGVLAAGIARSYSRRYHQRLIEAAQREARLGEQLAEARLDALRRQLDPHFLFNTLNTVSALVERDPRGVRRMIMRLSELLRHSFEGGGEAETPLRTELAMLNRYVEIMQVRFQGRLTVETAVSDDALDGLVPDLILQPLVENAIKHGVERSTGEGHIVIRGERRGDRLLLEVIDDGPGVPDDWESMPGRGVGLRNTSARLEQLHGDAASFTIERRAEGGTVARVSLPFHVRAAARRP